MERSKSREVDWIDGTPEFQWVSWTFWNPIMQFSSINWQRFVTKGSVSYLSLIAKAYCREGQDSVTDFAVFSRGYDLPPPPRSPRGSDPPWSAFFWCVCVCVCVSSSVPKSLAGERWALMKSPLNEDTSSLLWYGLRTLNPRTCQTTRDN